MIPKAKREEWVDAIKGLCMILILNAHLTHQPLPVPANMLIWVYVTLFFGLAGYTYHPKAETMKAFCRKKAARLLIPYVAYSVAALLCMLPVLVWKGTWAKVLLGIVYARFAVFLPASEQMQILSIGNAPLWFLPAMFVGYTMFRGLMTLPPLRRTLVCGGCFCLPLFACFLPFLLPWSLDVAGLAALCMLGGHMMQGRMQMGRTVVRLGAFILACAVFGVTGSMLKEVNISVADYGNRTLFPPLAIVCLLLETLAALYMLAQLFLWLRGTYLTRFLAWCGRISLTLMCTHMYTGKAALWILKKTPLPHMVVTFCCLACAVACCAVWVAFCRKFKDRWPLLQYL